MGKRINTKIFEWNKMKLNSMKNKNDKIQNRKKQKKWILKKLDLT